MPVENMEEEGLAKIPDLQIAQWRFELQSVPKEGKAVSWDRDFTFYLNSVKIIT